jgi:diguanylate cyclase (GGDEF)-like protein
MPRVRSLWQRGVAGRGFVLPFALVSFLLASALGVALGFEQSHLIEQRSFDSAKAASTSEIEFILALNHEAVPTTGNQQVVLAHQIDLYRTELIALAHSGHVVDTDALILLGPDAGTRLHFDTKKFSDLQTGLQLIPASGFKVSIGGATGTRTLTSDTKGLTTDQRRLIATHGDLLAVTIPLRLSTTGQPIVAFETFTALRTSRAQAAHDVTVMLVLLGVGLLVLWLALLQFVLGASRRLHRQTVANEQMATTDALTGLPNRALLRDRVNVAVAASRRSGAHVSLMLLDLDRFKEINDTLGHRCGDQLLQQVGPRLRAHLRDSDTIARLGGDEFVVLIPDLPSTAQAVLTAEKLTAALTEPFVIDGVTVDVGASIGVAVTPEHGDDFDELMQHADVAMYVAKEGGLGVVVYSGELDRHSPSRLSLLGEMRRAIEDPEQLIVYYQPKADLTTGRVTGVEALVRWKHPQLGMLPPMEFIPLAERTGLIRPLTFAVLREALRQNREWLEQGLVLPVAVNVSARCLLDPTFPDRVANMLAESGVPASQLELELTESTIMTDPDRALQILRALAAQGLQLAIDDFGTGYSSMAYLKDLPVTQLKIDRTFVTGMAEDSQDDAIVRSSLELARNLNLTVVAEGVETPEVWDRLNSLGCATAQGYFLSKPMPAGDLPAWLDSWVVTYATTGF